jgi:hypothetical protein
MRARVTDTGTVTDSVPRKKKLHIRVGWKKSMEKIGRIKLD